MAYHIFAEGLKGLSMLKVLASSQLFNDEFCLFFSGWSVMLVLVDFGKAFYSGFLQVDVSFNCKGLKYWDNVIMNLRHVKEMYSLLNVLE